VPQTAALADQKLHSRRGIDRLVEIIAHDANVPAAETNDPAIAITSGEDRGEGFYPAAKNLVPDLRHMSSVTIAKTLAKHWGCKPWKSGCRRGIEFPALREARELFDRKHGAQEWPPMEVWGCEGG
jgi:hypothetical protein